MQNYILTKIYNDDESEHEKLAVVRVVKVGSDALLGVDVELGQENEADSYEKP